MKRNEFDKLCKEMKSFEAFAKMEIMPEMYLIVRVDGSNFHSFTEKMRYEKPYSELFSSMMRETVKEIMMKYPTIYAYTQSDERIDICDHCGLESKKGQFVPMFNNIIDERIFEEDILLCDKCVEELSSVIKAFVNYKEGYIMTNIELAPLLELVKLKNEKPEEYDKTLRNLHEVIRDITIIRNRISCELIGDE